MKRSELTFTLLLIPVDFFALISSAMVAFSLRFNPVFVSIRPIVFNLTLEKYIQAAAPMALVFLVVFALAGLYSTRRTAPTNEFVRVVLAVSTSMAVVLAISFFSRVLFESRFIALAAWALAIIFVVIARLVIHALQRSLLRYGIGVHRVAIIGETPTSETLVREFKQHKNFGFNVVEHFKKFDDDAAQRLREMERKDKLDEILLADPEAPREQTLKLIAFTDQEHLGFRFSADLFAAAVGRSVIQTISGIPIIEVRKTPLDGWGAIYKRTFDIIASTILIVLTSPIWLITTVAIKLDTRGPIFFSKLDDGSPACRMGQSGKPFRYFKFRSMAPQTHSMRYKELSELDTRKGTPMVKIKNDPRVTKVGKFIRKFSIDELPELLLVFVGRMSLVGPRPHLPEEVDKYRPEQRKVMTIKPGITGMAQISGRADLDFDDEVRLDTYYIEHWNPWLDFYILLKTPMVVIFKKGAY
jgi:exopolysaccharide biosynthesis polyprenyl glycosylphosphotransferase